MSTPKRHHYLPQFYLKGFCRDELLCVYDRKDNVLRRQSPENTAVQTHYYTFEDNHGNKNTDIESMFAELEGVTKPVINKVTAREELSTDEKEVLALFVAFMMNRVPDFEKAVNYMEGTLIKRMVDMMFCDEKPAAAILDRYERDTGNSVKITPKELVKFHQRDGYKIEILRIESLRLMVKMSFMTANYFKQMDWVFMHAPEKTAFVTCDNPVYVTPPEWHNPHGSYGYGIITKGATKVMPLNQSVCMLLFDRGDKVTHIDINREQVRPVNLDITVNTDRFLIGRDHDLVLNLAKRTKLSEWKRKGRISMA